MMRPIAASESEITELVAAVRLKHCFLYLVPPIRIERPSTSSTLPMIDPVREAFTTLVRPLERAMPAMISSAAFPKVALSNPPRPSPTRAASASVARPIQPATGMMPRAEQTKSAVGLLPPGQKRSRIASRTKIRSQSRDGLIFRCLRISRVATANQPIRRVADRVEKVEGVGGTRRCRHQQRECIAVIETLMPRAALIRVVPRRYSRPHPVTLWSAKSDGLVLW